MEKVIFWNFLKTQIFDIFAHLLGKKFGFHTYSLSFDEGNSQNIIEISASDHIPFLDNNKFLLQYTNNKSSGEIHYRLASKSREDIEKIRLSSEGSGNILSIELRFS